VPAKRSADERKELLAQAVANEVKRGWRVESQAEFEAVMVKERRSIFLLHLLTIIFTSPQAPTTGSERREVIMIDEFGHTDILR
jgi:hypothetical protein